MKIHANLATSISFKSAQNEVILKNMSDSKVLKHFEF